MGEFAFLFIFLAGLVAGTLSGIVGFGSSIMLMPFLVVIFGPLEAVPIMAIAAVLANLSRVLVWYKETQWKTCLAYALTAAPAAGLGARALLVLPQTLIEATLGIFFLSMIPLRRYMARRGWVLKNQHLFILGIPIGFLTGLVVSTGPITAPLFLATGLVKGAFLATEAASSLLVYGAKLTVFQQFGALPSSVLIKGLLTGSSLTVGAFIAKRFVLKLTPNDFRVIMEGLMFVSGSALLLAACFH